MQPSHTKPTPRMRALLQAIEARDVPWIHAFAEGRAMSDAEIAEHDVARRAVTSYDPTVVGALMDAGVIRESEFVNLMCDAVSMYCAHAVAQRLLEAGADPLRPHTNTGRPQGENAFDCIAQICDSRKLKSKAATKLLAAIVARLSQQQKNEALVRYVRKGAEYAVSALLDAGADASQRCEGRTLVGVAPRGDKGNGVKRVLRAARTADSIEAAMGHDAGQLARPAATRSMTF